MAQRKSTRKTTKKKTTRRRKKRGFWSNCLKFISDKKTNIFGLVFLIVAILAFFDLGVAGALFANVLRLLVGNAYQVLALLLGAWGGFLFIGNKVPEIDYHYIFGFLIAFVGWILNLSVNLSNTLNQHVNFIDMTSKALMNDISNGTVATNVGGGMIGAVMMQGFSFLVSQFGTAILAFILMAVGVFVFFNIPIITWTKNSLIWIGHHSKDLYQKHQAKMAERKENERARILAEKAEENARVAEKEQEAPEEDLPVFTPAPDVNKPLKEETHEKPHITVASERPTITATSSKLDPKPVASSKQNENYKLPSVKLLTKVPAADQSGEYNAIDKNTKILQKTLKSFGVDAEIKNVSLGPSVTEYELHPAIGVKVSKIVNLSDDIALALAAKDIRIEAPIPGKSLIGIEVPNKDVSTVSFRDVFENQDKGRNKVLSVPLGKDVNGKVISCDITKMPHLLIAGSTGSGKSVAINGILTSILLKATPDQVKFMLIDPKKVELGLYNGIPHLLSPVVSEPKKAARALHNVVEEMEKRYELFAKSGQRNLEGYNKFITEKNKNEGTSLPTLPYIVVVVDELADLMMTVSNEVESAIIRLAQMGRAAGVHMILATQRPSVDVITGLIKANVPSRIAFAVSSGIDSRTILDTNGAEKLLGRGDMLYLPIEQNTPTRIQGSFISDKDVESVVDFVKQEAEPEYDESIMVSDADVQEDDTNDDEDELFKQALEFVVQEQKASTSMIQRRFRIGYNRAARIIDDMEQRGYIGAQHGSKPREVFKQPANNPDPNGE